MNGFLPAAVIVTAVAAWTDWRSGDIPNWLSFGALASAPLAHVIDALVRGEASASAIAQGGYSLLGGLVCAVVPLLLYNKSAIGGGDVKLFAAVGAICQLRLGIEAEIYGFLAAAVLAPARLAYDGKLFRTVSNTFFLTMNPLLPSKKKREVALQEMSWFRMGPAILLGTIVTAYLHHWGSR